MPRAAMVILAIALAAACAGGGSGGGSGAAPAPDGSGTPALRGELTVFAAASLTDAFGELAEIFEDDHPDVDVLLNLAGSQQLAGQVLEGAPADVIATASDEPMTRLAEGALLDGDPIRFASNRLAIVVEPGNPLGITDLADLADLADDALVLVLAAPEVPAGRYAAEALRDAGVTVAPDSLEVDVRGVLGKVALGEADAGIVYRSDVLAAGEAVTGIDLPADVDVVARYPIAVLAAAPNPDAAVEFLALVRSERGRAVLAAAGFGPPDEVTP
jgi:molybdate transport system substrate-binding protein